MSGPSDQGGRRVSLHVRHRHREQRADDQQRPRSGRRAGEVRLLQALADRLRPGPGTGDLVPPLRPSDPQDMAGRRALRLGVRRRHLRGSEAPRHHTDRGPLPLRAARLDRQLPEPRFPTAVPALCARLRRPLPLDSALYASQRDVHLRHVFGAVGLVE